MRVTVDSAKFIENLHRRQQKAEIGRARVMRIMGAHQLRSTALNFNAKGRKDDQEGVWPPLAESTIAGRKKGQRRSPMPLVATGTLKNSITFRVEDAGKQSTLVVGTNVPYAKYHQQDGEMGAFTGKFWLSSEEMGRIKGLAGLRAYKAFGKMKMGGRLMRRIEAGVEAEMRSGLAKFHRQAGELPKRVFLRFHRQDIEFFKTMCVKEFGHTGGLQ